MHFDNIEMYFKFMIKITSFITTEIKNMNTINNIFVDLIEYIHSSKILLKHAPTSKETSSAR